MRDNNKGFSLFEMVLVMAIVVIMAVFIGISVSTVSRNDVLRTSERLETMVNKARVNAMAKGSATYNGSDFGGNGWINIAKSGGSYYASVGAYSNDPEYVKTNGEKIGDGKLSIYVASEDDDDMVTDTVVRHLGFKQSTGGIYAGAGDIMFLVKYKNTSSYFKVDGTTGRITSY